MHTVLDRVQNDFIEFNICYKFVSIQRCRPNIGGDGAQDINANISLIFVYLVICFPFFLLSLFHFYGQEKYSDPQLFAAKKEKEKKVSRWIIGKFNRNPVKAGTIYDVIRFRLTRYFRLLSTLAANCSICLLLFCFTCCCFCFIFLQFCLEPDVLLPVWSTFRFTLSFCLGWWSPFLFIPLTAPPRTLTHVALQ